MNVGPFSAASDVYWTPRTLVRNPRFHMSGNKPAARSLLTYAFASGVLGGFRVPAIRDELETLLEGRLPGAGETQEAIA